jgi:hypothetical protein
MNRLLLQPVSPRRSSASRHRALLPPPLSLGLRRVEHYYHHRPHPAAATRFFNRRPCLVAAAQHVPATFALTRPPPCGPCSTVATLRTPATAATCSSSSPYPRRTLPLSLLRAPTTSSRPNRGERAAAASSRPNRGERAAVARNRTPASSSKASPPLADLLPTTSNWAW